MDRNLARKNVRTGLIVTAVCFFMFGMTFVAAAIYIAMSTARARGPARRRGDPPPGASIQPLLLAVGITVALVGVTTFFPLVIAGVILSVWVIVALDRATRAARSTSSRSSTDARGRRPAGRGVDRYAVAPKPTRSGTSQIAPSSVQQRTMSRIDSTPAISPPVGHDEVAEAAADHRDGRLLERPVRRGEDDVGRQVVGDALGVGILARADRVEHVALGDDARARAVGVEDDRRADPALGHQAARPRAACGRGPPSGPSWLMPSRTCMASAASVRDLP